MFKLFTRLKEISIKLPPTRSSKPRADRQPASDPGDRATGTGDSELARFSPGETADSSGSLYLNNAAEPGIATVVASEGTTPAPTKSGK